MNIRERVDGKGLTLLLDGNFDETTSPAVEARFQEALMQDTASICFDMSRVKYISSAGIRVLILSYKKAVKSGKKVTLANMSEKVREVVEMVGILPMFAAN